MGPFDNYNYNGNMNYAPNNVNQQSYPAPITNKLFASSVEDALSRPVNSNTKVVYFNQNTGELYEITTDPWGAKTPEIYTYCKKTVVVNNQNNKSELDKIKERLDEIEKRLANEQHAANDANS